MGHPKHMMLIPTRTQVPRLQTLNARDQLRPEAQWAPSGCNLGNNSFLQMCLQSSFSAKALHKLNIGLTASHFTRWQKENAVKQPEHVFKTGNQPGVQNQIHERSCYTKESWGQKSIYCPPSQSKHFSKAVSSVEQIRFVPILFMHNNFQSKGAKEKPLQFLLWIFFFSHLANDNQ